MPQKPSDLLNSFLEFFGILIPGAVLAYLHGNIVLVQFDRSVYELNTASGWFPAFILFFLSILLGHFLHSLSDPFDRIAIKYFFQKKTKAYLESISTDKQLEKLEIPKSVQNEKNPKDIFYAVFSFIRIYNPVSVVELERHAGEFKLFRSLTLLFLFDLVIFFINFNQFSWSGFIARLIILFITAFRFIQLFNWTYILAFDMYLQIQKANERPPP